MRRAVPPAGPKASEAARAALEGAHFAIWTTTPWTIPANLAVAINDALDYSIVEVQVSRAATGQTPVEAPSGHGG